MDDLVLRPPLGLPSSLTDDLNIVGHDETVRPVLCALAVAAHVLQLSVETQFTAACLVHRYYASIVSSSSTFDNPQQDFWKWILPACLFLACKTEEQPRRLRDVINCARMIECQQGVGGGAPTSPTAAQQHDDNEPSITLNSPGSYSADHHPIGREPDTDGNLDPTTTASEGVRSEEITETQKRKESTEPITSDPRGSIDVKVLWNPNPPDLDDAYWQAKAKIVETEQHVLRWIAFDCSVSHPHRAVVLLVNRLLLSKSCPPDLQLPCNESSISSSHSSSTSEILVMNAWRRLNDAIFSVQALGHAVLPLACAAVDLAILQERRRDNTAAFTTTTTTTATTGAGADAERTLPPNWWKQLGILAGAQEDEQVRAARSSLELVTSRLAS